MTTRLEVYKCAVCGNIVEVLHASAGSLSCCNQQMQMQNENTTDAAQEKHVPVIEKTETGYFVKIGSTPHPMTEEHYIQWIELIADDRSYLKFLTPGDSPEATFDIAAEKVTAREYCNIHGHWKAAN